MTLNINLNNIEHFHKWHVCLALNPTLHGLQDVRVVTGVVKKTLYNKPPKSIFWGSNGHVALKSIFGGSNGHVALRVYKSKLFLAKKCKKIFLFVKGVQKTKKKNEKF